jgi:hypothetical protein
VGPGRTVGEQRGSRREVEEVGRGVRKASVADDHGDQLTQIPNDSFRIDRKECDRESEEQTSVRLTSQSRGDLKRLRLQCCR